MSLVAEFADDCDAERSGHSERSEESRAAPPEALRYAQGDVAAPGDVPAQADALADGRIDNPSYRDLPLERATSSLRVETLGGSVAVLLAMTVAQRSVGFLRGILFCRWLDPTE